MSDRDLPNMDDVELPDIPDDEDLESADGAESEESIDESAVGARSGGRLGPLLAKLGPLVALLAALLARVSSLAAPLAPLVAPVGRALSPVAKVTAPIVAIASPLLARVPRPVAVGVGAFVGILLVMVVAASALSGGRGAVEASVAAEKAAAVKSSAPIAVAPTPRPKPVYTPTPSGPTPTPTPTLWEQRDKGWIARGAPLQQQGPARLLPGQIQLIDDTRDVYRLVVKFAILVRSGPLNPYWGVILAYQDETHYTNIHFVSDSYKQNQPQGASVTVDGTRTVRLGEPFPLAFPFWGRDQHELRVDVDADYIEAWLDEDLLGSWKNPRLYPGTKKGLFVFGPSTVRFDSLTVE
jgi:hypothetical protein